MSDVPSNLIPTRITQLPTAPVASEDSLLLIVYQGNNYQIRAGDLLSVAGVPVSRQVIAGTGLSGGGQLLNNVTLSVASKGINGPLLADTGVAAGVYGSSTQVPVFTVDSTGRVTAASTTNLTVSGYVPESREVIAGTGLTGGGTLNNNITIAADLSDATPQAGFQSGSAGVATSSSRSDHKHPAVDLSSDDEVDNILGLSNGGTAKSLVPDAGAVIWCGADGLYVGPPGLAGQVLVSGGAGEYTWGSALIQTDQAANLFYAGPASGSPAPTSFRNMVSADLPDSGVTANTYGSATAVPVVTVNAKGVITNVTTQALVPGLVYKGAWDASTNTPTLVSSTGTSGWYYVVSVAGSTNLDGITDWQVGDWAVFNGTVWQKIDQTNSVSSVNGQTGVVSLNYASVGAPSTGGINASGTWAIDISGNAATATTAGKVSNALTIGSGLGGTSYDGSTAVTITNSAPMTYPGSGIPLSTGTAWGTSYSTTGTGTAVVLATAATLNNPTVSDYTAYTPTTAPTYAEGRVFYDSAAHTLNYYNDNSQMSVNIGQEQIVRVRNQTGSTIPDGTVVYVNGATGNTPTVALAIATAFATSDIIGVTTTSIANNGFGYVTISGLVNGLDTSAFTEGQAVFLSPSVAGAYTATEPTSPNYSVQVGVVLRANPSNGTLLVAVQFISTESSHIVGSITNAQLANSSITINGSATALGGSINVGTVTSVSGTGTVSGISLSGTVTSSGSLTLGGALDLSSPPAIGGTTPAAITGTTITATKYVGMDGGTF